MKIRTFKLLAFSFVAITLISGCANKNAFFLKQGYHDLTAHYNSYFNAKETYNLTIKSIEKTRKDNFDEIIPLYAYGTLEDTKAQESSFTNVIDKSSMSIQLHQISNWSDDNFLLLGKAFYMQGNYPKAIESLRYVTAKYNEGVDGRSDKKIKKQKRNKKRKKRAKKKAKKDVQKLKAGKDIRPKKSLLVHEPTKSEALIWLVKTFTANEQFTEAEAVLDYIKTDNNFIQNFDKEVDLAYANNLIKQNLYSEAILHIENAIDLFKSNKKKSRYRYVLAQLYQKVGNKSSAKYFYEKSIKGNPKYDMIFSAKLNMLKLNSSGSDLEKDDRLLAKLIKDSKNSEYLDQLYFERAVIANNKKEYKSAKEFLVLSIENSIENDKQKALSYEMLADILYDAEDFLIAQENYSECLALIKTEHVSYKKVSKRSRVLTELVNNLNTITKNDSLLKISNLPLAEIESLIYEQAENIVNNEESAKKASIKPIDKYAANDKNYDNKWYFYSENAKKSGFAKFTSIWGDIKLSDNWRRSDKTNSTEISEDLLSVEELREQKIDELYETLLAELPDSDSTRLSFNEDIINAHYSVANIYKFDLENEEKAIDHFQILTQDFSASKYDAESLFNLYLLTKESNKTLSTKNKNLVLTKYPKSQYAKIIKDPSYLETLLSNNEAVQAYYEETYNLYSKEQYPSVLSRITESKTLFPNNVLEAKFALLEAVTFGKQSNYQVYVDALEAVITDYNSTEEEAKATEILAYLKGDLPKKTEPASSTSNVEKDVKENIDNSLFDANKGKEKEGIKVNFGKKEVFSVGTSDAVDEKDSKAKEDVQEIEKPKKP